MKKLIYSLLVCLSLAMVSCDKSTEDPSFITYYVDFEMKGSAIETVELGTPYVEPGVIAKEKGEDVSSKMKVTGTEDIDVNRVGVYYITYAAENVDGYPNSTSRMVVVYDPAITTDLSGDYMAGEGTQREMQDEDGTWVAAGYSDFKVTLAQVAPGVFRVSDFMGGYYDQGRGYGAAYAMTGYAKLNADNTLDILSGDVAGFGESYEKGSFVNARYNPAGAPGDLQWTVGFSGMKFTVVLNK